MMKSAADVEREVEASRGDLDRTLDAIKDKMSPGQLFDEASKAMGATGQQVAAKFMEQAKENPMPLAVMALGVAWLMTSSGSRSHRRQAPYEPRSFASEGHGGGLGQTAHDIGDKASDVIAGAKDRVAGAIGAVGDGGRSAMHGLSSTADGAMARAAEYRDRAQSGFARVLESEPLLLGAVGLIVGAAIGAALPHTELEDHAVGPLRDRLLDKGKTLAHDGLEQAGEVAKAAYEGVKDELAQPVADGDGLSDRVDSAVRAGVSAVREQTQGSST